MVIKVSDADRGKFAAVKSAADLIHDEMTVGLGTGTTSELFIRYLGNRIREKNLKIKAIPTSVRTEQLARSVGIAVFDIDDLDTIDICVDGADEILSRECVLKGGGGALLREKIVAIEAQEVVIIADNSKLVNSLGCFPIPIEVTPFGCMKTRRNICEFLNQNLVEYSSLSLRRVDDVPFVTDEGNYILDLYISKTKQTKAIETSIEAPSGVVDHGLFIDIVNQIHIGCSDGCVQVTNCIFEEIEHKTVEMNGIYQFFGG